MHPWWSHRIQERKDAPGFYADSFDASNNINEVTIASPNQLKFLSPSIVKAMASQYQILQLPTICTADTQEGQWCSDCSPLPHQGHMIIVTLRIQRNESKDCVLIACDYSLTENDCFQSHFSVPEKTT